MKDWGNGRGAKILAFVCVAVMAAGMIPLYGIALYNHPYYDDFGFATEVHAAWKQTHDLGRVFQAAVESIRATRQNWQGTFTGTIFSNLQPGMLEESGYFISSWFLMTAFWLCFAFFFHTVFGALGVGKWGRVSLSALCLALTSQFMPDPGEAFYWFNGGVGNLFIYSLLALSVALTLRLLRCQSRGGRAGLMAALLLLMVLLGGGSYGGGLFGLCLYGVAALWLLWKKHPRRWHVLALWVTFAAFFLYSVSAPGNRVRAGYIQYQSSAVKAVCQAVYYGLAQMGQYLRLPLLGVTVIVWPFLWQAAKDSGCDFAHPWLVTGLMAALYCTQLTPPLYSIASIGDGRIVNTYFLSFVAMWMVWVYYMTGFAARRLTRLAPSSLKAFVLAGVCLAGMGCMACKPDHTPLYGVQNLNGAQAALSILSGEAACYDDEMKQREALLNDDTRPEVTLKPLTAVPSVFMEDLLQPGAVYDVRPTLMRYYGKTAIYIEGEVDSQ